MIFFILLAYENLFQLKKLNFEFNSKIINIVAWEHLHNLNFCLPVCGYTRKCLGKFNRKSFMACDFHYVEIEMRKEKFLIKTYQKKKLEKTKKKRIKTFNVQHFISVIY